MSVSCDRYLAYIVDITDEFSNISEDGREIWLGSYGKEPTDLQKELNFYPTWSKGIKKDKVTILDDGLNGLYTKLMYIITYDVDVSDDETDVYEEANNRLCSMPVPKEVEKQIKEVYNKVFSGKQLEKPIMLNMFLHYR